VLHSEDANRDFLCLHSSALKLLHESLDLWLLELV
jgi:hypothetical protein